MSDNSPSEACASPEPTAALPATATISEPGPINGIVRHDKEMARKFLELIDPTATTKFTIQSAFDPEEVDPATMLVPKFRPEVRHGTLDELWPFIEEMNTPERGAGIFVTINATDFKGRKAVNITHARALFVDADDPDAVARCEDMVEATGAVPSAVVQSSAGKAHYYWVMDDLANEAFLRYQPALITRLDTDRQPKDLPRVMRQPGTLHLKDPNNPQLVTLTQASGVRYALAEFVALLGLDSVAMPTNANGVKGAALSPAVAGLPPADPERLRAIFGDDYMADAGDLSAGIDSGHWFDALTPEQKDACLSEMLDACLDISKDPGRSPWIEILMSAHSSGAPSAEVIALEWCRAGGETFCGEAEFDRQWSSFDRQGTGSRLTIGTLIRHARARGFDPSPWRAAASPDDAATINDPEPDEETTSKRYSEQAPAFSDDALALGFAARHENDLRYIAAWGKWYRWDGSRWIVDDTHYAFHLARDICREAAAECRKPSEAKAVASAKTEAAVITVARADRRLAATTDQWDADPWLLNTPGGVIDLRTGVPRPHRPEDYLTRMTAVAPGGTCPQWHNFLDGITKGDKLLQSYLARVVGYALTGSTREHALFFAHGTGANGKSTFLNTVSGIVGDYHRQAPIETFVTTSNDRHPTELAGLRGARLVTALETEEGRRWAEAKIKMLTGGDKIAARLMRQDFFEFTPQFKLFIAGNHKPGLRSVDEAIRRRFNLIPFNVIIQPKKRDPDLPNRLKDEWPGILAWMIDGCLDWQRCGLAAPKAVTEATAAYLEAEDAIGAWIDETCERKRGAWSSSTDLYRSWKVWADRTGELAGSQKRFSQTLEARGFRFHRKSGARGFFGLRIKP